MSHQCIFTADDGGGKIRGCPRFLGMIFGKPSVRLADTANGRWASIELGKVDRRGNATFRWR
ncbi:hypothetical protein GGQ67_001156 [Rhizobium metallidurans]|uniref:Uncharacterized protein n=1 Tax=Rhizobium metallidurans TaxID=1265931 RepID=A0A7W6CW85_9HYPH|nr:hypothetical protein [Rhizobium metallidurans]